MFTQQEARQALTILAREIVRLWNAGSTPGSRRFLDTGNLDVSDITWRKAEGDDASLSATWFYIDAFLDAARYGFKDLDGIPWPEAAALMEEVAEQLTDEQPIEDPRVLRYAFPERQGCNPMAALSRMFKPK